MRTIVGSRWRNNKGEERGFLKQGRPAVGGRGTVGRPCHNGVGWRSGDRATTVAALAVGGGLLTFGCFGKRFDSTPHRRVAATGFPCWSSPSGRTHPPLRKRTDSRRARDMVRDQAGRR